MPGQCFELKATGKLKKESIAIHAFRQRYGDCKSFKSVGVGVITNLDSAWLVKFPDQNWLEIPVRENWWLL